MKPAINGSTHRATNGSSAASLDDEVSKATSAAADATDERAKAPAPDGVQAETSPNASQPGATPAHAASPWLEALLSVARHYHVESSPERAKIEMEWLARDVPLDELIDHLGRQLGLAVAFDRFHSNMLDPWRLPMVADLGGGQVAVLEQVSSDGTVSLRLSGDQNLVSRCKADELSRRVKRVLLVKPLASVPDARVDDYIRPYQANWLWQLVLREWPRYGDVMVAALVINVLALGSMLFSMQVYDRVIPAQSEHTLWVLFGGLMLALVFSTLLRVARTHITDLVGKRADLRVSDRVFGHALRIRNDARPRSTGSFISQIRELEQVREMITSTTVNAAVDMPFFLLFAFVMWSIGGPLVWVPVAAVPLLIIPSLLAQRPLARLAQEGMRESALRSAILVEAVQGLDDIKLLRAETRFQSQWNHTNEVSATVGNRQRLIAGILTSWTQDVQTLVYAGVVVVGAYQVIAGELSTGVLIACSIMSSRMIAPLAQIATVATRWQQAKVARKGLDELMKKPVDQPARSEQVHRPLIRGDYAVSSAQFRYAADAPKPTIDIAQLHIRQGEKVALLGANGAGKTTLLQLLAGVQTPQTGQVMLDGIKLSLIDPSDVRRDVAMLNQSASLFFGTVRENITMGMPHASEEDIMRALQLSGAAGVVQQLSRGLDHPILEGGQGLSGGQRQSLLLARTLIREPQVLLLDEPTAWLDDASEARLILQLEPWLKHRTLVVATHRPAVLKWVDRIVVLDGGRVVADDKRDKFIAAQSRPPVAPMPADTAVGHLQPQRDAPKPERNERRQVVTGRLMPLTEPSNQRGAA